MHPQPQPRQRQHQHQHQHVQVHVRKRKRYKNSRRERLQPHDLPFARHIELCDEVKPCLVRVSGPCVMFGLVWLHECFRNEFPTLYEKVLDCRLHDTLGARVAYLYMKDRAAAHSICTSGTGPVRVAEGPSFAGSSKPPTEEFTLHFGRVFDSNGEYIPWIRRDVEARMYSIVQKRVLHRDHGQSSVVIEQQSDTRLIFPAMPPMSDEEEEEEVETMFKLL